ncbi:DUF4293 domain-containing protein [Adhaeribacter soli]|uniref:DUF4293 family protein n=1 Tax=Adhaeribacter soli TaxID=2607655 RepID=A0A5N1IP03_9BACT|nr:DUF4293 domain-containing protein [Adhaeribacter soli]KAA9331792.1 DUF4293 family protein [Adhaeribacter soli]
MIQRIQSVFLLLLALCMVALLFLPIWSKTDPTTGQTATLTAFSLSQPAGPDATPTSTSTIAIGILAIIAAGIALYEIFQFKNRITQMKLGMLNTLVLAGLLGAVIYYSLYVGEELVQGAPGEREAAFYLPLLALLLNMLANRFIRRDEQLVRSVDRLR